MKNKWSDKKVFKKSIFTLLLLLFFSMFFSVGLKFDLLNTTKEIYGYLVLESFVILVLLVCPIHDLVLDKVFNRVYTNEGNLICEDNDVYYFQTENNKKFGILVTPNYNNNMETRKVRLTYYIKSKIAINIDGIGCNTKNKNISTNKDKSKTIFFDYLIICSFIILVSSLFLLKNVKAPNNIESIGKVSFICTGVHENRDRNGHVEGYTADYKATDNKYIYSKKISESNYYSLYENYSDEEITKEVFVDKRLGTYYIPKDDKMTAKEISSKLNRDELIIKICAGTLMIFSGVRHLLIFLRIKNISHS